MAKGKDFGMASMSLDDVYRAAMRLPIDEQDALVSRLLLARGKSERVTRDQIIAETELRRAAGAFQNLESLAGKFKRSGESADADAVESYLYNLNNEWEEDIDGLAG